MLEGGTVTLACVDRMAAVVRIARRDGRGNSDRHGPQGFGGSDFSPTFAAHSKLSINTSSGASWVEKRSLTRVMLPCTSRTLAFKCASSSRGKGVGSCNW